MKKNFIYALMSAIALTGAMDLTSCSNNEEIADVNPNFNPETNEVVTNFVFNVANSTKGTTRMSSAATQATTSEQFRGIDDAKLFTFTTGDANDGKHLAASADIGKTYNLASVIAAGQVTAESSNRIIEIALPLKTNALVFYGKAPAGTVSQAEINAGYNAYDVYGRLLTGQNEGLTNLSDITFSVSNRLGENATKYHQAEQLLAAILTCIMNTNLSQMTASISKDETPTDQVTTKYLYDIPASEAIKAIKWADYANGSKTSPVSGNPQYALEEKLANVYSQMTSIKTADGELRAASGEAIIRMVQDMWTIASEVRHASPLSYEEAVAKYFAQVLFANINNFFNATTLPVDGTAVSGVGFKALDNLIPALSNNLYWPTTTAGEKPSDFSALSSGGTEEKKMQSFPGSFNIPTGASHIMFDNAKQAFSYPSTFNTSDMGTPGSFGVEDYFYCPEIVYFGNSPVRTSAIDHKTNYPNGVSNWNNESYWPTTKTEDGNTVADWNAQHVLSTTRSVAMKNNINYGVALLKTTVGVPSDKTYWKDNNHAIQKTINPNIGDNDEPDNEIEIKDGAFTLTGVIIGGQSKHVGWDLTPRTVKTGTTTNDQQETVDVFEYVNGFTYDKAIPSDATGVPTATGKANYTLVFDNYDSSKAANEQPTVNVALEFVNNTGKDFYGNHNLIRNGGTFYLIGALNPQRDGLTAPTWPTDHPLPPYNNDGSSIEAKRVFMQDYMTVANFVIGEESLKKAYLTVPDLRATSLTLGLSVDIEWRSGINFGDVILGQ